MAPHAPTIELEPGALGDAISESMPMDRADLFRAVFHFGRELFTLLDRKPTDEELRGYLFDWVAAARRGLGLEDLALSEVYGRACESVRRMRTKKGGKGPGQQVLDMAATLKPSRQLQQLYPDDQRAWRLGAFCRAANEINGDVPFPLPVRYIGEYLDCSRMTASRLIQTFMEDGLLQRVVFGNEFRGASKFRWKGHEL